MPFIFLVIGQEAKYLELWKLFQEYFKIWFMYALLYKSYFMLFSWQWNNPCISSTDLIQFRKKHIEELPKV